MRDSYVKTRLWLFLAIAICTGLNMYGQSQDPERLTLLGQAGGVANIAVFVLFVIYIWWVERSPRKRKRQQKIIIKDFQSIKQIII